MQNRIPATFIVLPMLILCFYVAPTFSASSLLLWILTLSFIALLFLARYQNLGYGYVFLTLFLFLGLWAKPFLHLIYPYPYSEPVGGFANLPIEWNEIMKAAISGIWGVIFAGLVFQRLIHKDFFKNKPKFYKIPSWYLSTRRYLWVGFVFSLVFLAIFNVYFGVHQIGLPSQNYFVWPTNALISMMLVAGFPIILATLLWWDISLNIDISKTSYCMVFESSVSSISLLSRGIVLFHSLPLWLPLWNLRNSKKYLNSRQILLLLVVIFLSVPLCYLIVNYLRDYRYFDVTSPIAQFPLDPLSKFFKFSIDRWVGIEGLMAVASYPDKNFDLLIRGLMEFGSNPMGGIYQEISLAHYRLMDMEKFIFASIPGPIGFFYYSGSLAIVFLGMFALTFFLVLFEVLALHLTSNPIVCSFYGFSLANFVSQFGVFPRNSIPYLVFLFAALIFISCIQSRIFCVGPDLKRNDNV
jgi:hypothetical protein